MRRPPRVSFRPIAKECNLAESTVRIYVSQILNATGCASRSEIAVLALKTGLQ
ncbi:MAG: LuxR C-terminal-related transcriptional regulator [Corynebacterium sp.]|nr:LuxR C-terminal-related transcriptional regulator [Corynebacterium sp.]